ncbi:hypothetical protein O181_016996 [Austropuccinia psidii MF-1]|uniref:Reverse transcriptase Ty1/copia-type domain-containing protein n=1 Tax=Austropuccinia psidii MF-1 TaxID=1389203 RepID=A0A9Q3GRK7_9BASI|nr:hypothetical protein [Austropuccinia psidii MF-1]
MVLVPTKTDPCLYYSSDHNKPMWLFAHVDDLIFSGCWNEDFKAKIKTFFDMEDLRSVKYALGIRITQSTEGISMIQDKLIQQILSEFTLENARPLPPPFQVISMTSNPTILNLSTINVPLDCLNTWFKELTPM